MVLPITNGGDFARRIGFAVPINGGKIAGVVRCDQPRVLDLGARGGRAHGLAAELARRLDTSMTEAVTIALEEKLAATADEVEVSRRLTRMLSMANAIAGRLTPEQKAMDVAADLYDADGLPR